MCCRLQWTRDSHLVVCREVVFLLDTISPRLSVWEGRFHSLSSLRIHWISPWQGQFDGGGSTDIICPDCLGADLDGHQQMEQKPTQSGEERSGDKDSGHKLAYNGSKATPSTLTGLLQGRRWQRQTPLTCPHGTHPPSSGRSAGMSTR